MDKTMDKNMDKEIKYFIIQLQNRKHVRTCTLVSVTRYGRAVMYNRRY